MFEVRFYFHLVVETSGESGEKAEHHVSYVPYNVRRDEESAFMEVLKGFYKDLLAQKAVDCSTVSSGLYRCGKIIHHIITKVTPARISKVSSGASSRLKTAAEVMGVRAKPK